MTYRGKAVCFESLQDAIDGLRAGKIKQGDAAVAALFSGKRVTLGSLGSRFRKNLRVIPNCLTLVQS